MTEPCKRNIIDCLKEISPVVRNNHIVENVLVGEDGGCGVTPILVWAVWFEGLMRELGTSNEIHFCVLRGEALMILYSLAEVFVKIKGEVQMSVSGSMKKESRRKVVTYKETLFSLIDCTLNKKRLAQAMHLFTQEMVTCVEMLEGHEEKWS